MFYMYVYVYVCVLHVCLGLWRSEEGIRSPGTRVIYRWLGKVLFLFLSSSEATNYIAYFLPVIVPFPIPIPPNGILR